MSLVGRQGAGEGESTSAEGLTDVDPASTVAGLDDEELAVLGQVGGHWGRALGPRRPWVRALPIDPGLHRFPSALEPGDGGRFAPIDFVETADPAEIVATRARRRGRLVDGARGIDVAAGVVGPAAERKCAGARADAQTGGAGDPLVGRAVVGRLRT
jgi:hypothetical protein